MLIGVMSTLIKVETLMVNGSQMLIGVMSTLVEVEILMSKVIEVETPMGSEVFPNACRSGF